MKRKWFDIFINVAVPIMIGAVLYYLFCPDIAFVQRIDDWAGTGLHLSVVSDCFVYRIIRNYLFDFLWAYSLMSGAVLLCSTDSFNRRPVVLAVVVFEILMELSQLSPDIKGTCDIFDLIAEGVANVLVIKNFQEEIGMKKSKVMGLVLLMLVFGMMSLGSGSDSDSGQKEITTGNETSADSEAAADAEGQSDSETALSEITIEEQVLFEKDGLKVTATEYVVDSVFGDGIRILVENDNASDIGLGCDALIVNDYMITDLFSTTVAAGKKDYETLSLSSTGLEAAGIETVGKIEIYFYTFDPNSYTTIDKMDCVTIQTSAFASMDTTPNDAGQELYNEGGVRIVGKYVDENSFWGAAVLLYIENNSGRNVIIQCDDMSVNGFMTTPLFSSTVYDGKKAIDEITLLSSDLEENNITSVDEIELKFKIIDEDFTNSVESDAITFSTK